MRILFSLANYLPHLTLVVALGATLIGVLTCPLESPTLAVVFLYVSAATVACVLVTFLWHAFSTTPYRRVLVMGFGVGPFVLLWFYLSSTYGTINNQVREGSARTQMTNNGKNVGLALHDFHDRNKRLPVDVRSERDEALLSWRVSILPFIDQMPLYQRFDQTKSWNSPPNHQLLEPMPSVFRSILFEEEPAKTPWQGFVGPGTVFEPGQPGLRLAHDFPNGTSFTVFVVEAQQHVPWSKPGDIPYGPDLPLPPLGHRYRYWDQYTFPFCCNVQTTPRYLVCMGDATVRMFTAEMPEANLRALIVRNGNQGELPD